MGKYNSLNDVDCSCPHDRGECFPADKTVANYKPLSADEVTELLALAKTALEQRDGRGFSKIQVRFGQAIPGMTCPKPINGLVAERLNRLDRYFVDCAGEGPTARNINELSRLIR